VQPPTLKHRRSTPGLASLAAAVLALGACSGSAPPAPTSILAASPTGASAITTATMAPNASPHRALPLVWKCTAPTSSQPSFQPLAVDPRNGDVWATVPFDNLFWICDPTGKYLESWGTAGSGPGQFDLNDHLQNPDGFGAIAFAPDGSFFVGDVGNNRIEKFDAKRKFVKQWGSFGHGDGQFAQLVSVATNGKTVVAGDGDRVGMQAFDLDGTFLRTFGRDGFFGAFLAIDPAGNAYATNPSTPRPAVAKFDPTGTEIARFDMSSIGDAVGVAVAPNGHVFVGAASRTAPYQGIGTYELDRDLRSLRAWSTGAGGYLALSAKGDTMYISGFTWPYVEAHSVPAE
jgi:hypothetical protein